MNYVDKKNISNMISFEKILCNHHQFTKPDYWYQHVFFFRGPGEEGGGGRGRGWELLLISVIKINRYIICVCLAFFHICITNIYLRLRHADSIYYNCQY